MKIALMFVLLLALFALSVFCVHKIKTKKSFLVVSSGFLVLGFLLLWLADFASVPTLFYLIVFVWGILGLVGWYGASWLSKRIDAIGSKLFHIPHTSQAKEDDFEDDAPETSIKLKYYVIAAALYALYLMTVLPEIH